MEAHIPAPSIQASAWSQTLWESARLGDAAGFRSALTDAAKGSVAINPHLRATSEGLNNALEARETKRGEKIAQVNGELDKLLAEERTNITAIKALRKVIELQMLSKDRDAVLAEPRIAGIVNDCVQRANAAEKGGQVLDAVELFFLLDAVHDVEGTYRPDVRRIAHRQEMLRTYVPERFWEMHRERSKAWGEKDPGEYNPVGDDWRAKFTGINKDIVKRAMGRMRDHIERVSLNTIVVGGLEAVRTMITTEELEHAFPNMAQDHSRVWMVEHLDREIASIAGMPNELDMFQIDTILDRLLDKNENSVRLPGRAVLHEFGNGCGTKLDEYTQIIWPDEVRRFKKNTEGKFVGVGVSIEHDEMKRVRVVTPLEGTPAQRAGIHSDDILTKVDGKNIFGLTLDQVVDLITGKEGTTVVLTVERKIKSHRAVKPVGEDEIPSGDVATKPTDDPQTQEIEFAITRASIDVPSVKGWKRSGVREDAWDWMIDKEHGVGYVRVLQFSDKTTAELDRAVRQMKQAGVSGVIIDLRFNPGGLLDQAVSVAQRFLPFDEAPVVMARDASGDVETIGYTSELRATLAEYPVVVLVNEGSASASEIVSGAISVYARQGKADAVVLGARSFGKGSVQNVWPLSNETLMKVTTAYYMLPDASIIHRRPGKKTWGVQPHLAVEMLPDQNGEALLLRRNADVLPLNQDGFAPLDPDKPAVKVEDLIDKGIDLQLHAALVLLQARAAGSAESIAASGKNPSGVAQP